MYPLELVHSIYDFLPLRQLQHMPFLDCRHQSRIDSKLRLIREWFPLVILGFVESAENLLDVPFLTYKDSFMGGTDYLDRIRPYDMTERMMMGKDPWNRPFLCIKRTTVSCYEEGDEDMEIVETIFQRYSDDPLTWTHGCCGLGFIQSPGYLVSNGQLLHSLHLLEDIPPL